MTVPVQDPFTQHTANGVTDTFAYDFLLLLKTDLTVTVGNTTLTQDQFSITGLGEDSGGTITILSGAPGVGVSVTLIRQLPLERDFDYQTSGDFRADTVNKDFDRLWQALQDGARDSRNSLKYPFLESVDGTLPAAGARKGMLLGFDTVNGVHTMVPIPSSVGAGDNVYDTFVAASDFTPGVTTQLILSRAPGAVGNLSVNFDGVFQGPDQWGIAGTTLTFTSPIPVGVQKVFVRIGTTLSSSVPPDDSVGDDQLSWGAVLNRVVDSIAALKLLDGARYRRAFVTGYYAAGDGGGGNYYLDGTDATSADNGGTVIVAADGSRWKLIYTQAVSVRQFGAKGDGVTNDTVAFQKAIDALVGSSLYIPRGTPIGGPTFFDNPYIINAPLVLNSTSGGHHIFGDGTRWDNNWGAVGGSLIKNTNAAGGHAFVISAGKNGLNMLEKFGILGNGSDGDGIQGTDLYNTHINRLLIAGQGGYGIRMIASFNSRIESCLIGNVKKSGIYWNGLANGVSTRKTVLFGCNGANGGYGCIEIDGAGGNSLNPVIEENTFEPNVLAPSTYGIIVRGTNGLVLKGNYFEIFPNTGRIFYGDVTLRGFDVQGNYFQDGTVEFAQCTFGTIDNNVFYKDTITTNLVVSPPLSGANEVRVGRGNIFLNGATNGAPAARGVAALTAGSVVIPNANSNTGLPPILSRTLAGGVLGHLLVGTILNGTSFQVVSSDAGDTSTFQWEFPGY